MRKYLIGLPLVAIALGILATTSFSSCKKDKTTPAPSPGGMKVQFSYVFGSAALPWSMGTTYVQPKTGDTLTFSMFRFYVSNIRLKKSDGTWWAQPESYFLLNATTPEASAINVDNIPAGTYTAMEYTMGVDSARNVSGANTGALSLANGMFWDWNSGYIMLKAEGTSPNSSVNTFAFHLGGFSGDYNVVTVKSTDFGGKTLTIENGKTPVVTLLANPARLWHTSPSVSVLSVIHAPSAQAKTMANDFYSNISFSSLQ